MGRCMQRDATLIEVADCNPIITICVHLVVLLTQPVITIKLLNSNEIHETRKVFSKNKYLKECLWTSFVLIIMILW